MAFLASSGNTKFFFQGPYIGGNPSLKEWQYVTPDSIATILAASYITDTAVIGGCSVGDSIRVIQCSDRYDLTTQTGMYLLTITGKSASTLTLARADAETIADLAEKESDIVDLETAVAELETDVVDLETAVAEIETDVTDLETVTTPIASVAALRLLTTAGSPTLTAVNLLSWSAGQRIGGGRFAYDATDTTTADDGGTCFVDTSSRRHKRLDVGPMNVTWFGALPDNATSASAAFALADAAAVAAGTKVLIPTGTFYLATNVTMASEVIHFGTIRCASVSVRYRDANPLRYSEYKRRYSTDQLAFEGMLRDCYVGTSTFRVVDMEGMSCTQTTPVDWAVASNKTTYNTTHRIKNGVFIADATFPATVTTTKTGGGTAGTAVLTLNNTTSLTAGQFVSGPGVATESYILSVNSGANQVTLNTLLYATKAAKTYTFKEFKYLWDMSGMTNVGRIRIEDCNLDGNSLASGIRMSQGGIRWSFSRSNIVNFLDRGIVDWNLAASGMRISDECLFAPDTSSVGSVCITFTDNDAKINNNHFLPGGTTPTCIVGHGSGYQITGGNHIVGDDNNGVVLTGSTFKTEITGNYIDNCYVVFGDEAANTSTDPIQGLVMIGNTFTAGSGRAATYRWIICKPTTASKKLAGIIVKDNIFRKIGTAITRVEKVNTAVLDSDSTAAGTLDPTTFERVLFDDNDFESVSQYTRSRPCQRITVAAASESATWTASFPNDFPFGGSALRVRSAVLDSAPKDVGATVVYPGFYALDGRTLGTVTNIQLRFTAAYSGSALVTADCNVSTD